MPVSDSDIRNLIPQETIKRVSVGDSLYIVMELARKSGGKSFYGYIYFPPGVGGVGKGGRKLSYTAKVQGNDLRWTADETQLQCLHTSQPGLISGLFQTKKRPRVIDRN